MDDRRPRFGLTLPNRGVILGSTTVPELLALADAAEAAGWDAVWVGDSILAKPRVDALVLLGALAGRTRRVRLGVACMSSTPLRDPLLLAYQWASLDFLSGGRTTFVACIGQLARGGGFFHEFATFGVDPRSRRRRLEEAVEVLRLTSSQERASYQGQYTRFQDVTVLPRPVQQPLPIWIVASPDLTSPRNVRSAYARVAQYGDGWMTTGKLPAEIRESWALIQECAREQGRALPPDFAIAVYHNVNVQDSREAAVRESKRYLDTYYDADFSADFLDRRVAMGPPAECVAHLRRLLDAGVTDLTLRLTSYDQQAQFRRVTEEVLPALV